MIWEDIAYIASCLIVIVGMIILLTLAWWTVMRLRLAMRAVIILLEQNMSQSAALTQAVNALVAAVNNASTASQAVTPDADVTAAIDQINTATATLATAFPAAPAPQP